MYSKTGKILNIDSNELSSICDDVIIAYNSIHKNYRHYYLNPHKDNIIVKLSSGKFIQVPKAIIKKSIKKCRNHKVNSDMISSNFDHNSVSLIKDYHNNTNNNANIEQLFSHIYDNNNIINNNNEILAYPINENIYDDTIKKNLDELNSDNGLSGVANISGMGNITSSVDDGIIGLPDDGNNNPNYSSLNHDFNNITKFTQNHQNINNQNYQNNNNNISNNVYDGIDNDSYDNIDNESYDNIYDGMDNYNYDDNNMDNDVNNNMDKKLDENKDETKDKNKDEIITHSTLYMMILFLMLIIIYLFYIR
jgi:hypothetical protein